MSQQTTEEIARINRESIAKRERLHSTERPSSAEVARFLEVFRKLSDFEAQSRLIRGWGIMNPAELPDKAVVKVGTWLMEEFDVGSCF